MPQRRQLLNKPPDIRGEVKYPEQGVNNLGDDVMRAIAVALGLQEQKGGDVAGLVGALGSLLPVGKLLKFPTKHMTKAAAGDHMLREHLFQSSPKLRNEFDLMSQAPAPKLADLPQVEIDKALELTKRQPQLRAPKK